MSTVFFALYCLSSKNPVNFVGSYEAEIAQTV